ncbi:MAG TPA: RNA-binding protein [Blastocatellia bacterium]|nr:RNA-binding protein [Blastocatellia bacterium]
MPIRLFVGNLPYDVTEAELREHFSAVGPLSYIYLPTDRETGKLRGFAFVEFDNRAHAEEAIRRFNNQLFKGRPLGVKEARAKEARQADGPLRPSLAGPGATQNPITPKVEGRREETARRFGSDTPARRDRSKTKARTKSGRGPKGPMREVVRGQFFGGDEDDFNDDELMGENFASRVDDSEANDGD